MKESLANSRTESMMEKLRQFMKRKDIEISGKRYGIDALGAMAQELFWGRNIGGKGTGILWRIFLILCCVLAVLYPLFSFWDVN